MRHWITAVSAFAAVAGTLGLASAEQKLLLPAPASDGPQQIALRHYGGSEFPTPNSRRVGLLARQISLESNPSEFKPGANLEDAAAVDGIWSDGWSTTQAELILRGGPEEQISVHGMVPDLGRAFSTKLDVIVDGKSIGNADVKPGELRLALPIPASERSRRIVLQFDDGQNLPAPDSRRVGMLVRWVAVGAIPSELKPNADGLDTAMSAGVWSDGWAALRAEASLAGGDAGRLVLRGMVPDLGAPFATKLAILVDGVLMDTLDVAPGDVIAKVRLPASNRPRRVVLEFADGQDLPAPDGRRVGMRISEFAIKAQ